MHTRIIHSPKLIVPIVTILLVVLFFPSAKLLHAAETWTIQNTPVTNGSLYDMFFTDSNTGWAVGREHGNNKAVVIHTVNAGGQWTIQDNPLTGNLDALFFVDASAGYAAGQDWTNGKIAMIHTTNGGQIWQSQTLPDLHGSLEDLFFTSASNGWAVGMDFDRSRTLILQTTNGTTWTEVNHPFHAFTADRFSRFTAVHFSDSQHGWVVGYDAASQSPVVLKTTDGGTTWVEVAVPVSNGEFTDVSFTSPDTGVVAGVSDIAGVICRTADGGTTWQVQTFPAGASNAAALSKNGIQGAPTGKLRKFTSLFLCPTSPIMTREAIPVPFYNAVNSSGDLENTGFRVKPGMTSSTTLIPACINGWGLAAANLISDSFMTGEVYQTTDGGDMWSRQLPVLADSWIWKILIIDDLIYALIWKDSQTLGQTGGLVVRTTYHDPGKAMRPLDSSELTTIGVTPASVNIHVGEQRTFTATGRDQNGNPYPISNPEWSVGGPGTLSPNGTTCTYTATAAGNSIIRCREGGTTVQGYAYAFTTTGSSQLTSIDVTPASVSMEVGEQRVFTATGRDQNGNPYTLSNPTWTTSGGGTLAPSGTTCTYTATQAGDFTITCGEGGTTIQGTATIHTTSLPDLRGTLSNLSVKQKKANHQITSKLTVYSDGAKAANVTAKVYLSNDNILDAGDTLLGTVAIGTVKANSSKAKTIKYNTTDNPTGKYLIAVIDPDNQVPESNEGNNIVVAQII